MSLLTRDEVEKYLRVVNRLPDAERQKVLALLEMDRVERCKDSFLYFVKEMWPIFISGRHHAIMADAFERVLSGDLKRLIICMPPRHTKSEFASYLLPAWFLGKHPEKKIIQCAHTSELAVGFGRKVRNLVQSAPYQKVFKTKLSTDSKAAGRWNTDAGGDYFAIGVGGAVTGKGADCAYFSCKVRTKRGAIPVSDVFIGDEILTERGFKRVTARQRVTHADTYCIDNDLKLSANHPVFVYGQGFIPASDVELGDALYTTTVWYNVHLVLNQGISYVKSVLSKRPELLSAFQNLQHLGADAAALFKSSCSQLHQLWRSWGKGLRTMGVISELYRRYGSSTLSAAYVGSQGQQWRLHTRELPMGYCGVPAEQSQGQCFLGSLREEANTSPMGERNWTHKNHDSASYKRDEDANREGASGEEDELDTKARYQESLGWLRAWYIRIIGAGKKSAQRSSGNLELFKWACQNSLGILLGIRRVTRLSVTRGEYAEFFNFTVDDTHTFICENRLTHNCLIIDDPHSEQEAKQGTPEVFDKVYEWFTSGPRQRLQPGGAIIVVQTRWSKRDLVGQLLKNSEKQGVDDWEVIEFPAIMPSGTPLWPAFWSKKELEAIKAEIPVSKWEAQYQQNPTSEEGAIIKRNMWKIWEKEDPPECDYLIQSWDTAFEKSNRADYSACTTWGIFYKENADGKMMPNIILLDAFKRRMEFPELKEKALEMYNEWKPDSLIVEKKAAGAPLIYEMRQMGIPLSEYTPSKGHDKIARVNSISDLFASGVVWCPDTRWADELMEEMAAFPNGDHDDLTDSSSQALIRFRQGGFITLDSDYEDEKMQRRSVSYY